MKAWNNTRDTEMKYTVSGLFLAVKTEAQCNQSNLLAEALLTPSTLRAELFVHPLSAALPCVFVGRYAGGCVECVSIASDVCWLLVCTCVGLQDRLGTCGFVRGGYRG